MSRIYLCGPIQACSDEEAHGWRDMIQVKYPEHEYRDPMIRDYRGRTDYVNVMNEIVELDKFDISESDILLVNWPGDKPSAGTSMEVIYGWQTDKLVVVVYPEKVILSPWVKYHSHAQFNTWEEAMDWIFFNKNKRHWRELKSYVDFVITPVDGANDPFDLLNKEDTLIKKFHNSQKANSEHESVTHVF